MPAHFVLAHPEPQSFNAHLVRAGVEALTAGGWTTTISGLYAQGFDPCERPELFGAREDEARFDVQAEPRHAGQRHAAQTETPPAQMVEELARRDRADLLILQYPMRWRLPPAILKGWFDRVWAYGEAYTSAKRFENGRFIGKRAMLSVTPGTSRETYRHDGRSGDNDLMLWPVNFNLAYVGYTAFDPFVAYGVEAGLQAISRDFQATRQGGAAGRGEIAFNCKAEWGPEGRIAPGEPVHSPFIRRIERLRLA